MCTWNQLIKSTCHIHTNIQQLCCVESPNRKGTPAVAMVCHLDCSYCSCIFLGGKGAKCKCVDGNCSLINMSCMIGHRLAQPFSGPHLNLVGTSFESSVHSACGNIFVRLPALLFLTGYSSYRDETTSTEWNHNGTSHEVTVLFISHIVQTQSAQQHKPTRSYGEKLQVTHLNDSVPCRFVPISFKHSQVLFMHLGFSSESKLARTCVPRLVQPAICSLICI